MSTEHETQKEIRRILRLLEATANAIETSSIDSDSTKVEGGARCARQFNNALTYLIELDAVPEGLFEPLEADTTFGDIYFACHQVTAYLKEGICEDFDFAEVKKTIGSELKDVGEVVRQSMPAFLKDVWSGTTKEETDDSAPVTVEVTSEEDKENSVEQRIEKLEGQMETIVEILQELRAQQVEENRK